MKNLMINHRSEAAVDRSVGFMLLEARGPENMPHNGPVLRFLGPGDTWIPPKFHNSSGCCTERHLPPLPSQIVETVM